MKATLSVAILVLATSWLMAQVPPAGDAKPAPPALFPEGYLDHDALGAALKAAAAAHPDSVRVESLAKTLQGRDLWLATLGRGKENPAILLVANLEADHVVGSQVALKLVEKLAKDDAGLLDKVTFYVVPRLNADGAERLLKAKPAADFRLDLRAIDRDRDGRKNEDGPDDLNGDGVITRMWVKDAKATLLPDSTEPRLLRKADPAKGERGVYSEYAEGIDNDGDGQINEDPPGGVNLNRNWPHRWTEFDPEAGEGPVSEPATYALIKFAFEHPEIAAVLSFSLQDNLKSESKPGLDAADQPLLVEISKAYNKAVTPAKKAAGETKEAKKEAGETKKEEVVEAKKEEPKAAVPPPQEPTKGALTKKGQGGGGRGGPRGGAGAAVASPAPVAVPTGGDLAGTTDGAISEWAYHQFGVPGLAARLWSAPEIPEPPQGEARPPAEGDARWLYWNDKVAGGRAFVPLKPFDHPTLGKVEIGGWRPGVRLNPPAAEVEALADGQLAFLKDLAGRVARLEIQNVKVEAKGGGLFQVTATVENAGFLPVALAQGVRVRKTGPVLVRLEPGAAKILTGRALNRIENLAGSGGKQEFRWLILAPEGTRSVTLEASHPKAGRARKVIELK